MNANCFFLPKRSNTHADALAVAGLAHMLANIGVARIGEEVRVVTIRDRGASYELRTDRPVTADEIQRWDGDAFYPYVLLKGDNSSPPVAFDYEAESKRLLEWRKVAKAHPRKRGKAVTDAETAALREAGLAPHPETAFLRAFNGMRKGFKGDIALHAALRGQPPREAVMRRLAALVQPPVDGTEAPREEGPVQVKLSASQWFMPVAGKGVSRVKADGASPGQFREELIDWFETWLRFIGMYRAMTSHGVGDDLRLAVMDPAEIDGNLLPEARAHLRDRNIFGGKIDVRAPMELARFLVEHSVERLGPSPGRRVLRFDGARTRDVVRGLHVTTYKKMGTSSSVMNVAFLGIPSWAPLKSRRDTDRFLDDLDELDSFQNQLRDDISEDIVTLREMRDFVSSGDLGAALGFFARVAFCVMQRMGAGKFAVIFQTDTVRRILMGLSRTTPDAAAIEAIMSSDAFNRMAKAVRAATIQAQLHSDSILQPRYGLAQAWRQQAAFKSRFIQTLAEFVQRFNADVVRQTEIDRKADRLRPPWQYPDLVTEADLRSVLRLIESHGSSLVVHLLLAFGFAQTSKAEPTATNPPPAQ